MITIDGNLKSIPHKSEHIIEKKSRKRTRGFLLVLKNYFEFFHDIADTYHSRTNTQYSFEYSRKARITFMSRLSFFH